MTLSELPHGRFRLLPEAAKASVQAMIPVFSAGLTFRAANPAAIGAAPHGASPAGGPFVAL